MALSIDTGVMCVYRPIGANKQWPLCVMGTDIDWELNLFVCNGNEDEAKYALNIFLLLLRYFVLVNREFKLLKMYTLYKNILLIFVIELINIYIYT